ncbi:MAG: isoprenylcysteine carboxylmethyltransferase family protein [Candidatus Atribacteria bacterium]|nr:isoprenylcysteine carboxylmethyltransferase family protein [Candidatus Atribacteria bacterium]
MSLIPAFEIGVWNAWILQVFFLLVMIVPDFLMSKEAKLSMNRMNKFVPFVKHEKILAYSTHMVIMPLVFIYSIFLPLKLGTAWLYAGLPIFALSVLIYTTTIIIIAGTPGDRPVTGGVYRITRHPIYLGGFLMYLGTGIACASWVVLLCALLWITFFIVVVPTEEHFLIDQYGDVYREYMKRTPRWMGIPK